MGEYGYGKKSTIGKGRFVIAELEEVEVIAEAKTYMTLCPSKLDKEEVRELFYDTFVRFGKLGGSRAAKNAFKVPQLLADTAAVVCFDENKTIRYVGQSIRNISSQYKDAVQQGYAIVLPIKELMQ